MAKKKEKIIKDSPMMEFLLTYGFAIFIVLIVIGALAYFGVLNTERFTQKEEKIEVTDYEPLCEKYCEDIREDFYGGKCVEVDNETIEVVCDTCTNFVSRRIGVKKSYLQSLE